MINYFIPLLVYLAIMIGVTLLYAGKYSTFSWSRLALLIIATPFLAMTWLELLKDRGELKIKNLELLRQNQLLRKKVKVFEK